MKSSGKGVIDVMPWKRRVAKDYCVKFIHVISIFWDF